MNFHYCIGHLSWLLCVYQGIRSGQTRVVYSLYGVVEHSGRLSGGHYTAYVKVRPKSAKVSDFLHRTDFSMHKVDKLVETLQGLAESREEAGPLEDDGQDIAPPPGKWYYISDSRVNEVTHESNVLRCQAYLLFYERIY